MKPRPSDIHAFLQTYPVPKPLKSYLQSLATPPAGERPGTMKDAWERAPNGRWLAWIARKLEVPELAAVRARKRRFRQEVSPRAPVSSAEPVPRALAWLRAHRMDRSAPAYQAALRAYAGDLRTIVKNPFESP